MSSSPSLYLWGGGDERRRRRDDDDDGQEESPSRGLVALEGQASSSSSASSSRQRWNRSEVWPEPFVEALAYRVASDAARTFGALAAAPALSNLFQVCSTWQSVSRSDHLWQTLNSAIWGRDHLFRQTWRDEYIIRHRTASNFRHGRGVHRNLQFHHLENEDVDNLRCRRLALSHMHLACGLVDGSVRVFDLTSKLHIATFHPHQRDRLGLFSRAVSGVILSEEDHRSKLVFASLDGDVHVGVMIRGGGGERDVAPPRRVQMGNVVSDGTLVDFTGSSRWWVGLYAGVPGVSFHVWDAESEGLVFVGGALTDPESVMGWHLLTELNQPIGRVRMTDSAAVVACTGTRVMCFDMRNQEEGNQIWTVLNDEDASERGVIVDCVDVSSSGNSNSNESFLMVDTRRVGRVRRVRDLQQVCSFRIRGGGGGGHRGGRVVGCMNAQCVFIWSGGVIRTWDARHGAFLYHLTRRRNVEMGGVEATAMTADDTHLVLAATDTTIHIWDFVPAI